MAFAAEVLLTLLGAGLGAVLRYALGGWANHRLGPEFPWGTLAVNVAGCFLVGLLFYLLQEREAAGETARAAVFVGLLGGFTTFSSYGLQTFALLRDGRAGSAALNVVASNLLGVLSGGAGYAAARLALGD